MACSNSFLSYLTTGETDGVIRSFDLFTAYDPGYFLLEVLASDLGGHGQIATVGIYILRDDQRVKIVINEIPENVRKFQDEFIKLLSNITGAIVNTDDVQVGQLIAENVWNCMECAQFLCLENDF